MLYEVITFSRKVTLQRIRVAEALERLPLMREALREGLVHWSAARELSRQSSRLVSGRSWVRFPPPARLASDPCSGSEASWFVGDVG